METGSIRNEYDFSELSKRKVDKNPFRQFEFWLKDALSSGEKEPTAMTLATVGTDGTPQLFKIKLKLLL